MNNSLLELKYVTIDDNTNYVVMDKISGTNNYVYLVNASDNTKCLIQKLIQENNEDVLINLDNEEEFNEAIELYTNKNKN